MSSDPTLANPAWHSLLAADSSVVRTSPDGRALAYQPDVTIWGAWEDPASPDWDALAVLAVDRVTPALLGEHLPVVPDGWTVLFDQLCYQMVRRSPPTKVVEGPDEILDLGSDDVEAMLALTDETGPGPFAARTYELGGYIGIRDGNELVAMAGRRMSTERWAEISAVCTAPSARRRGLARRLSDVGARRIEAEGRTPILHVLTDNTAAVAVYEQLGFTTEREIRVLVARVGDQTGDAGSVDELPHAVNYAMNG